MNMRILKIMTILVPAIFVGVFEFARHELFEEHGAMMIGNVIVVITALAGGYFFSRFIFGIIERMQREGLRRNQELVALNTVALSVVESLDLHVVLNRALEKVLDVTGAEAGELFLRDEQTQEFVQWAHTGQFPEVFQETGRFRIGEGFAGEAARTGTPVVVEDLSNEPGLLRSKIRHDGFRSMVSVPICSKNSVIGVINIATKGPQQFTHDDTQLLSNIGNQIAVALENARLHERVQGMAAMEERERIAREMHDSLGQVLGFVNTKSQAARELLSHGEVAEAGTQLRELEDVVRDTYADVREAILGLRSTTELGKDLTTVLREYIVRFSQMTSIKTELEINNGRVPSLSSAAEIQVIRIVQEALTNVRKHSKASHAWVRISAKDDSAEVIVEDDGEGFGVADLTQGDWLRFGLQTMKERAESVGGSFEIESTAGKGCMVTLKVPIVKAGQL